MYLHLAGCLDNVPVAIDWTKVHADAVITGLSIKVNPPGVPAQFNSNDVKQLLKPFVAESADSLDLLLLIRNRALHLLDLGF